MELIIFAEIKLLMGLRFLPSHSAMKLHAIEGRHDPWWQ
jgi:hypothetical protein